MAVHHSYHSSSSGDGDGGGGSGDGAAETCKASVRVSSKRSASNAAPCNARVEVQPSGGSAKEQHLIKGTHGDKANPSEGSSVVPQPSRQTSGTAPDVGSTHMPQPSRQTSGTAPAMGSTHMPQPSRQTSGTARDIGSTHMPQPSRQTSGTARDIGSTHMQQPRRQTSGTARDVGSTHMQQPSRQTSGAAACGGYPSSSSGSGSDSGSEAPGQGSQWDRCRLEGTGGNAQRPSAPFAVSPRRCVRPPSPRWVESGAKKHALVQITSGWLMYVSTAQQKAFWRACSHSHRSSGSGPECFSDRGG